MARTRRVMRSACGAGAEADRVHHGGRALAAGRRGRRARRCGRRSPRTRPGGSACMSSARWPESAGHAVADHAAQHRVVGEVAVGRICQCTGSGARGPLPSSHARPGLRRQGMRLPVPQGDLRPDVRAGHARHAVLHRLPEADRPALPGRRRRRHRAREGRGPAGLRRPRSCSIAPGRGRAAAGARRRGLDRVAAARVRGPRISSATFIAIAATNDTDVNIARLRGRRAPRDAREHRRRAAAVQLHPAGDRAHRPAGDRDLHRRRLARRSPSASSARSPTSTASPTRGWRCCSTRRAAGPRARCRPTRTARRSSRAIVNGDPDPIELLRAGDEHGRARPDRRRPAGRTRPRRPELAGAHRASSPSPPRSRAARRRTVGPRAGRRGRGGRAARSSRWRSSPTTSR